MRNQSEGFEPLTKIRELLHANGYRLDKRPTRHQSHESYTKAGGSRITITSHRGLVSQAEYGRIEAFVARR